MTHANLSLANVLYPTLYTRRSIWYGTIVVAAVLHIFDARDARVHCAMRPLLGLIVLRIYEDINI